jgi:hypothetical protein
MNKAAPHEVKDLTLAFGRHAFDMDVCFCYGKKYRKKKNNDNVAMMDQRKEIRQMKSARESPVAPTPADRNHLSVIETVAVENDSVEYGSA